MGFQSVERVMGTSPEDRQQCCARCLPGGHQHQLQASRTFLSLLPHSEAFRELVYSQHLLVVHKRYCEPPEKSLCQCIAAAAYLSYVAEVKLQLCTLANCKVLLVGNCQCS